MWRRRIIVSLALITTMVIVVAVHANNNDYGFSSSFSSSVRRRNIMTYEKTESADDDEEEETSVEIPLKTGKIIGGYTAPETRYSFAQISLQLPKNENDLDAHQCGGSLIASDIIITAAHCNTWYTTAHVNRHDFINPFDTFQIIPVQQTIVHPQFDSISFNYDYALVILTKPALYVPPVRINDNPNIPLPNTNLTILGWGAISNDPTYIYPTTLQKGQVQSMSNFDCENVVINGKTLYKGDITEQMLCGQNNNVDSCAGDSGGPAIIEGTSQTLDLLVGSVSWGRGCNVYPGVYSRISSVYDWIRTNVCYNSINPPSYFLCQESERNPNYINNPFINNNLDIEAKNVIPTTTIQPTIINNQPTPTPSQPTLSPTTATPTTNIPTTSPTIKSLITIEPNEDETIKYDSILSNSKDDKDQTTITTTVSNTDEIETVVIENTRNRPTTSSKAPILSNYYSYAYFTLISVLTTIVMV